MAKKTLTQVIATAVLSLFFVGCAAQAPQVIPFTPQRFETDQYLPKVDTFIVVFDASSSMTQEMFNGRPKIDIAKDFAYRMNQTIPELKMKAGLRSFGQESSVGPGDTALVYGVTGYTTSGMKGGIDAIKGRGLTTPISPGLRGAGKDLESVKGPMAVILVSDGKDPSDDPMAAAKALKEKYGSSRLCIYTVGVGNDIKGLKRLQQIADIGKCGFSANAADLLSAAAMGDFVSKVFLTKRPEPKPEPKPAAVAPMAPMDSDGDGVPDDRDKCPGTPKGASVNTYGCWIIGTVHFDFDKSNIKAQFETVLNKIASVMAQNPALRIRINGHTDSKGTAEYNQALSERRALSAKQYLISKGIGADRLDTAGHGFRQPMASNNTDAGQAQNRRVELEPIR